MPLPPSIADSLLDAWALLVPVDCAGCGAEDRSLCPSCRAALTARVTVHPAAHGLSVWAALRYEQPLRRIILAYKEHQRTDVARALAAPLASVLGVALAASPGAELAPVPTSRSAYRRRGYDPVRLLLRTAGFRASRVLAQTRATGVQKSLGIAEREQNLRGAFTAVRPLGNRRFVVVDDIFTSGATVNEAVRAIRQAGGEVVGAATLAFTPRLVGFRDIPGSEDYRGAKGAR